MNKQILILAVCCSLLSFYANAQAAIKNNQHPAPVVTKGYYAIGRNAEKLTINSNRQVASGYKIKEISTANTSFPQVQKGFYATESNRKKLGKTTSVEAFGVHPASEVKKGYYSIGRNAEKKQK